MRTPGDPGLIVMSSPSAVPKVYSLPKRLDKPLLIVALGLVVIVAFSSYRSWRGIHQARQEAEQTRRLLDDTNVLLSAMKDAETGQRGYLLTGSESYLAPYNDAASLIPALADRLVETTRSVGQSTAQAERLRSVAGEKLAELAEVVSTRRERGLDAALSLVLSNRGQKLMDEIRAIGETITGGRYEYLISEHADRERRHFRDLVIALIQLAGLVIILVFLQRTVDRGIVARERLVADVDAAQRRIQTIFQSLGDAVITSDSMGMVTLLNPVAERLTGWKAGEAVGQPTRTVFRIVNETTKIEVESPITKVLRTGQIAGLANHTVLINRQGDEIPIDDSGAPIRDEAGQVLGVVLVFRDITERRRSEQQIEKWHQIFRQAKSGIVLLDREGETILETNGAFAGMHGYTPDELAGMPLKSLVVQQAPEEAMQSTSEDHSVRESVHHRRDGSTFHGLTDVTTFRDKDERLQYQVAYLTDISDRKQAELKLKGSEARFRAAVEAVGDLMWTTDSLGEMNSRQPDWEAFTKQSFAEYRGLGWIAAVHPDDAASTLDEWRRAVAERRKLVMEHRLRRHDSAYRLFSLRAVPVWEGDAICEWVGVHADITDDRRKEEEIRESQEHFSKLAQAFPQLIWTCDGEGVIEYANDLLTQYAGFDRSDPGQPRFFASLMHNEESATQLEQWKQALASGSMFEAQVRLKRTSDGAFRWFLCRAIPMRGSENRIVKWIGSCTDIDEQMRHSAELSRANEALQKSNADLEQFAYAASHDIQEPLRMISLYTQLLKEDYAHQLDSAAKSYIDLAITGAQRMERLLHDLLAYSRVSATATVPEITDAGDAARTAIENLEEPIRRTRGRVEVGSLPPVRMASIHLVQLFQNLISNALKYCGNREPEVRIEAEATADYWIFAVRDNGIGIEEKYATQIFGIFKRLHGQEYEGTGIGLAVCQRIVERNGGRIWLESTPGVGSTFLFTIPR